MTDFSLLPVWMKLLLSGSLFISILFVGALCLYEIIRKRHLMRRIVSLSVFTALFVILSYLTSFSSAPEEVIAIHFPYIAVIVISLAAFAYGVSGIVINLIHLKNEISPLSVKQALDNLNSGICFCDVQGRIILINRTMGELFYTLIGSYPRSLGEISASLETLKKADSSEGEELYRFPDNRVWRFNNAALTEQSLKGFVQISAQDVTELYEANKKIESDNELLRITNEKTTEMLERLSDRIRQQETLALKMRVHNDIGSSLIKISRIILGGADEDMETQLRLLRSAVGYFSTERNSSAKTLEDIVSSADEMNVEIVFYGDIPENEGVQRLITLACRECVTNCVKHADGDRVFVKITPQGNGCFVSFKNNGNAPDGEIKEGGGLSSLRRSVEDAGGKMNVLHFPDFELQLYLKSEEAGNGV